MREKAGQYKPLARKDRLAVQSLAEELLVYDLGMHKVHCLNPTAAFIWNSCDGQTTVSELTERLKRKFAEQIDEEVVWFALNQLEKDQLLEHGLKSSPAKNLISRRALVRRIGIAAVLIPLVTTISAPTALACVSPCAPP